MSIINLSGMRREIMCNARRPNGAPCNNIAELKFKDQFTERSADGRVELGIVLVAPSGWRECAATGDHFCPTHADQAQEFDMGDHPEA